MQYKGRVVDRMNLSQIVRHSGNCECNYPESNRCDEQWGVGQANMSDHRQIRLKSMALVCATFLSTDDLWDYDLASSQGKEPCSER